MNVNGVKTSLLNMMRALDLNKYEVTVLLLEKRGVLLDSIPKGINVIAFNEFQEIKEMAYLTFRDAVSALFNFHRYWQLILYIFFYFLSYTFRDPGILYSYLIKRMPELSDNYDYAVSYFGPLDILSYYILYKTCARKKVQWIHFDVRMINFDIKFARKYYHKFDKIYTVSNRAKDVLEEILRDLSIESFILPIPKEDIINLSKENTIHYQHNKFQIVTIGRLVPQKGPDIALTIAKYLKKRGVNFEWHFIGGGEMYDSLRKDIISNELKEYFYLEGEQINPFRYLPEADLYVQPSRHEGYGLTLQEAKAVGVPIVCTNFTGANEQIENGVNGIIVNNDTESLLQAILNILQNKQLRENFRQVLRDDQSLDNGCSRFEKIYMEE